MLFFNYVIPYNYVVVSSVVFKQAMESGIISMIMICLYVYLSKQYNLCGIPTHNVAYCHKIIFNDQHEQDERLCFYE